MSIAHSKAIGQCLNNRSMYEIAELGVYPGCGMGSETVKENWFGSIWRTSRKSKKFDPHKSLIGILAFEVSRLMSKVVNIWQCLGDQQIVRLREEIVNSIGIQKLVSRDNEYLMNLVVAEIMDNLANIAKSVAILGQKCEDPIHHNLERMFDDPGEIDPKWIWWQYRLKKMERKVKKMERFVACTEQLYQELEVLQELEQNLKQIRGGAHVNQVDFFGFQRKLVWQRMDVKNLKDMTPWVRTYDYTVRLLFRSLFTIMERIKHLSRNLSVCTYENKLHSSFSDVGLSDLDRRSRNNELVVLSPVKRSYTFSSSDSFGSYDASNKIQDDTKQSFLNSKPEFLNAPVTTLGYAALALHFANIILIIKKLASAPHLINDELRDDLYIMLPTSIRNCLRSTLKPYSKSKSSLTYDAAVAAVWKLAVGKILEWLTPLALNTVRWYSDTNIERKRVIFGSNVLLVQTLYFADRVKTEEAIIELLTGLNYLARFHRGTNGKTFQQSSCSRVSDGYISPKDKIYCYMIDDTSL